jgi:hypothetical protein
MMGVIEAEDGGAMPTHDGRCPRRDGENTHYVWAADLDVTEVDLASVRMD